MLEKRAGIWYDAFVIAVLRLFAVITIYLGRRRLTNRPGLVYFISHGFRGGIAQLGERLNGIQEV
ncbi:MAG TPA: hypothetical protein PLV03_11215, partial [Clostridiales bacterium]|nr:hypothetical protein [Clostridiales bacterium]